MLVSVNRRLPGLLSKYGHYIFFLSVAFSQS